MSTAIPATEASSSSRPPRWLIGCKVALVVLLTCGSIDPDLGGFEGKGMIYRLPLFVAPGLFVFVRWRQHRGPYPTALDAALTLPFLLDTAANGLGIYDRFDHTDDVLHFVNWFILIAGLATGLAAGRTTQSSPRWLLWTASAGIGAGAAVAWEVAEYGIMRAGVGGLSLTYGDTVSDLMLSTTGGCIGAAVALRNARPAHDA